MTERKLVELIEGRMPFPATVGLDSNLFDELGFDSILLLDLIVSIEQACSCRFSDEDLSMDSLATPRRIMELVARRIGRRGNP
jgi:acyl carrier protein